jgi:hypothetical protein
LGVRYPTALPSNPQRSWETPRLLDQPGNRDLTLTRAQRLQHESDFGYAPRPLTHVSLQYEILALTGNERECDQLGHHDRDNRGGDESTE